MRNETRFRMTEKLSPERYKQLLEWAQQATEERFSVYQQLAGLRIPQTGALPEAEPPSESQTKEA